MTLHHTLLCDNSLCVVNEVGTLKKPELHLAVWHGGHPEICDACSLKAHCDELFGPQGKDCKIHAEGERWVEISRDQQESLEGLFSEL